MNNKTFLEGYHFVQIGTPKYILKINVLYINDLHENKLKIKLYPAK